LQGNNESVIDKTVNKSKAKSTVANDDENGDDDEASKTLVNDDVETTETTLQSNDGNNSTNSKLSPEKEKSKKKSRLRSSAPIEVEPSQEDKKESESNTSKASEKTSDSEAVIKEVVLPDKDKPQPGDKDGAAKMSESELDKSKRVSGQGMARPKTPTKTKKFHNLRAISTPQVNKTVLGENVTFLGESVMDLSAITVLSPPSSLNDPDSRRTSSNMTKTTNKDDTDAVSFRFKKGGRDLFEKLVSNDKQPTSSEETGKRKKGDLSPDKEKNPSKKTRSSSGLDNIEEEENQAPAATEDNVDGKRRRSRRR